MRARTLLGGLVMACASLWGCASQDDHQVIPPVVLGMLETAAPTYDDGQMQIYEVFIPVELPLRRATAEEREQRGERIDPYPRAPFHFAADTRVTARYTISNLEDKQHAVELLLDPWNEFVRYVPGITQSDEMTTPNFSGITRTIIVPPMGRVEGIITPDDMVELATDLATAMRLAQAPPAEELAGPVLFNHAFNFQNRSSEPSPVIAPFIPKVIAGLTGFDLGLRSYAPAKVAVEVILDLEDVHGDRIIPQGDDQRRVGRPGNTLTPPAAPARM
ncbi:MAG: hypothetical protein KF819_01665 [Labilithrix sp.]|nr:hypothetical protein [Labilithrix sp.]